MNLRNKNFKKKVGIFMEMVMSANYVEMTDDEMMYVDGGIQVYQNLRTSNYKVLTNWYLRFWDYIQYGSVKYIASYYSRAISYTCTADIYETAVGRKIGTTSWAIQTKEYKTVIS
ncbi:hypothetical protein RyT2_14510 [Pseudolactococcus yaeyamensis]